MSETIKSILIGLSGIYLILILAIILTIKQTRLHLSQEKRHGLSWLFLLGIALQCGHFTEEYLTGFYIKFPQLLGLSPWPASFFVAFNLCWIALWLVSTAGIYKNIRLAFFLLWVFIMGCLLNLVAHPLLALAVGGYFPGLFTSPLVGVVGIILFKRINSDTN